MNNKQLVTLYLGELTDRALRFYSHLATVEAEFYKASVPFNEGSISPDKPNFLESFRECISTVLDTVSQLANLARLDSPDTNLETIQADSILEVARHAFVCI